MGRSFRFLPVRKNGLAVANIAPLMPIWVVIALGGWLLLAVIGSWAQKTSPRPDMATALLALMCRLYCRWFHGLTMEGEANVAAALATNDTGRPIVVVANHAAGIDPFLIQAVFPRFIRWMVGMDTVVPAAEGFVRFANPVIIKGGGGSEMPGVREAIRFMAQGGIMGVFPEGRIARAPHAITPFQPGIGLIIGKSRPLVLPAVITGVPIRNVAYSSFFVPSRSRVTWMAPIDYAALGLRSSEIAPDLQGRYAQWLGARVVQPSSGRGK